MAGVPENGSNMPPGASNGRIGMPKDTGKQPDIIAARETTSRKPRVRFIATRLPSSTDAASAKPIAARDAPSSAAKEQPKDQPPQQAAASADNGETDPTDRQASHEPVPPTPPSAHIPHQGDGPPQPPELWTPEAAGSPDPRDPLAGARREVARYVSRYGDRSVQVWGLLEGLLFREVSAMEAKYVAEERGSPKALEQMQRELGAANRHNEIRSRGQEKDYGQGYAQAERFFDFYSADFPPLTFDPITGTSTLDRQFASPQGEHLGELLDQGRVKRPVLPGFPDLPQYDKRLAMQKLADRELAAARVAQQDIKRQQDIVTERRDRQKLPHEVTGRLIDRNKDNRALYAKAETLMRNNADFVQEEMVFRVHPHDDSDNPFAGEMEGRSVQFSTVTVRHAHEQSPTTYDNVKLLAVIEHPFGRQSGGNELPPEEDASALRLTEIQIVNKDASITRLRLRKIVKENKVWYSINQAYEDTALGEALSEKRLSGKERVKLDEVLNVLLGNDGTAEEHLGSPPSPDKPGNPAEPSSPDEGPETNQGYFLNLIETARIVEELNLSDKALDAMAYWARIDGISEEAIQFRKMPQGEQEEARHAAEEALREALAEPSPDITQLPRGLQQLYQELQGQYFLAAGGMPAEVFQGDEILSHILEHNVTAAIEAANVLQEHLAEIKSMRQKGTLRLFNESAFWDPTSKGSHPAELIEIFRNRGQIPEDGDTSRGEPHNDQPDTSSESLNYVVLNTETAREKAEKRRHQLESLQEQAVQATNEADPFSAAKVTLLQEIIARNTDVPTIYAMLDYALRDETTASLHKYEAIQHREWNDHNLLRAKQELQSANLSLTNKYIIGVDSNEVFDRNLVYEEAKRTYQELLSVYRAAAQKLLEGREYETTQSGEAFDAYYDDREIEATRMLQRHLYAVLRSTGAVEQPQQSKESERSRKRHEQRKEEFEPIYTLADTFVRNNVGLFRQYTFDPSNQAGLVSITDNNEGSHTSSLPEITVRHYDGTVRRYNNIVISAQVKYPDRATREHYVLQDNIIPDEDPDAVMIQSIFLTDTQRPHEEKAYFFFNGTQDGENMYGIRTNTSRSGNLHFPRRESYARYQMREHERILLQDILEQLTQEVTDKG